MKKTKLCPCGNEIDEYSPDPGHCSVVCRVWDSPRTNDLKKNASKAVGKNIGLESNPRG